MRYITGMTDIDPIGEPGFTYAQVANHLTARIKTGEFKYRLPTERALAEEYDVAYQTIRRAMRFLRERGVVVTRPGKGTFVAAGPT